MEQKKPIIKINKDFLIANIQQILNTSEIYDRGEDGFKTYAEGMDGSMQEKAKILPFVKPGNILELGSGSGTTLELLANKYSQSSVLGIDISDTLLQLSKERDYLNDNVVLAKVDIRNVELPENYFDTIVLSSVLHEVFSYSGYDHKAVDSVIDKVYAALKPGGRIIIRDGVKPESDTVYIRFKNSETEKKFYKFAEEFGPHKINYTTEDEYIGLDSTDAMEFLSKYIYEKNWDIEVKEQFGVHTEKEYTAKLEEKGFKIVHNESYLIDWLKDTHYTKDVGMYVKVGDGFLPKKYPDSTMIMVGEKNENTN